MMAGHSLGLGIDSQLLRIDMIASGRLSGANGLSKCAWKPAAIVRSRAANPPKAVNCNHRHIAAVLCAERTNISQKFKAIPFRQSDIGQNNIWTVFSDCLQSLESIWTGKDFSSVSREKVRDAI